jgi:hypothetical protein
LLKRRAVDAQKTTLLFAFGDSYADVGNTPKTGPNFGHAWVFPYGITWPGKPAGRFSDGKTQTDWLGKPFTRALSEALVNRIAYENRNRVVQRLNITLFFYGCAADLLGLPVYPPPYFLSSGQDTSYGVNFAVGGSGVTPASNPITLGSQVDNFELFLRTDPYSKAALANSLTLVSVVGNDYLDFKGNTSSVSLSINESISCELPRN